MTFDPAAWKRKVAEQHAEARRDWADPDKVKSSMRLVLSSPVRQLELGKILASLVNRHAPANLGLLPPKWHPVSSQAKYDAGSKVPDEVGP